MEIVKNFNDISNVVIINTHNDGPTIGISAGVHGNENAPVIALENFYKKLLNKEIKLNK
jgi:succinylglutamate desuccinylase